MGLLEIDGRPVLIVNPRAGGADAGWIKAQTEEPVAVEADGELLGSTPISARVVPRALSLKR